MKTPTPKLKPNYDSPWKGSPKQDNKAMLIIVIAVIIMTLLNHCS